MFQIDDLLSVSEFARRVPWDLSPDSGSLAVSVTQPSRREPLGESLLSTKSGVFLEANGSYVLVVDVNHGTTVEPFADLPMSWGPRWSPDGRVLAAYVVPPDGEACLGLWHASTGKAVVYPDARVRPTVGYDIPQWTPDSQSLLLKVARSEDREASTFIARGFDPADENTDRSRAFEERGDSGAVIAIVCASTGKVDRLTGPVNCNLARLSPDGRRVAYLARSGRPVGGQSHYLYDLCVVDIDERTAPTTIVEGVKANSYGTRFSWSPDSNTISYVVGAKREPHQLRIVDAQGHGERLVADIDSAVSPYIAPWWTADSSCLVHRVGGAIELVTVANGATSHLVAEEGGQVACIPYQTSSDVPSHAFVRRTSQWFLAHIDYDAGAIRNERSLSVGAVDEFAAVVGDDVVLLKAQDGPSDTIMRLSMSTGEQERLLVLNGWRQECVLPTGHSISFTDQHGREQVATLFLPATLDEEDRLPLCVYVYPGRRNSDHAASDSEVQLLVDNGFAVLHCDSLLGEGAPIPDLVDVTLRAVDAAIQTGYVDAQRIAALGHSYGAYGVLALLTESDRFVTGVANGGSGYNMTSTYGFESSAQRWCEFPQAGNQGTPWDALDRYLANSPFFRLDRVTAPLLLVYGDRDEPARASAREVFLGLRRLGRRVELRGYRDEQHVMMWSGANTRAYFELLLQWLESYLKTPEPGPAKSGGNLPDAGESDS